MFRWVPAFPTPAFETEGDPGAICGITQIFFFTHYVLRIKIQQIYPDSQANSVRVSPFTPHEIEVKSTSSASAMAFSVLTEPDLRPVSISAK